MVAASGEVGEGCCWRFHDGISVILRPAARGPSTVQYCRYRQELDWLRSIRMKRVDGGQRLQFWEWAQADWLRNLSSVPTPQYP